MYLVRNALQNKYKVIAGIHKLNSKTKEADIQKQFKKYSSQLTIKSINMEDQKDINDFLGEANIVIHAASTSRKLKTINLFQVLYPEIEGLLNLLTTCKK